MGMQRSAWGAVVFAAMAAACGGSSEGGALFGGGADDAAAGGGGSGGGAGGGVGGAGGSGGSVDADGGPDGQAGSGGSAGDACAPSAVALAPVVSETYALVDVSGSMVDTLPAGTGTKSTAMISALAQFVSDPRSRSLRFGGATHPRPNDDFSGSVSCTAASYAPGSFSSTATTLTVPPSPLADSATQGAWSVLLSSPPVTSPEGSSPWQGALAGALAFAQSEQVAHPDRLVSVLFLADAPATQCAVTDSSTIATQVVAPVATGTPAVRTFVVGLTTTASASEQSSFAAIASAGQTSPWVPVPLGSATLLAALEAYRHQVACSFVLPKVGGFVPAPGTYSLGLVASGQETTLDRVANEAACAGALASRAWFPGGGDRVTLCADACDRVLDDATAAIELHAACAP